MSRYTATVPMANNYRLVLMANASFSNDYTISLAGPRGSFKWIADMSADQLRQLADEANAALAETVAP